MQATTLYNVGSTFFRLEISLRHLSKYKRADLYRVLFCYERALMKSKMISNDQELIQSDPTSCPQNQKGNN